MKIDGADDVDVVKDKRLVFLGVAALAQKPRGFFQAAAGVEQNIFARKLNVHAKIAGGFYMVDDHVCVVMDVDDDIMNAKIAQARERDFQQRSSVRLQPELWGDHW